MADKELSSSEKTWEKGPPPPSQPPGATGDDTGASCEMWATEVDAAPTSDSSSIELKSGVIPYDNVPATETKLPPDKSDYDTNDDLERQKQCSGRHGGSLPDGVKLEDLVDSGVSQEDLSQVQDSIMQDNMQDIEDRKPNLAHLGSDVSPDLGTDSSYTGLNSPAYTRNSLERSVEATVSESERNGNFARMASSSRESLAGSCDSNANIKGMARTLSDAHCTRQDAQFQSQESITSNDKCSPNRTENEDIHSDFVTPEKTTLYECGSESASQELLAKVERRQRYNSTRINPTISLSVESVNDAMSPPASPTHSPMGTPQMRPRSTGNITMSFIDRKVQEILETERSYVKDLDDIIQHYQATAMEQIKELDLSMENLNILFGNLQDVHRFNKELLEELEMCNNDAVEIAECFLEKEREFSVYTDYCTNYPDAVEILTECTKKAKTAEFFRKCQICLGHALPLGAYLLKPVQRVLKYHLLFQDMHKHFHVHADGYDVIQDALDAMTFVAHHINEMKRKHEAAVHVQEIQSQMVGLEKDLNSFGDLVLEDVFRLQGARAERYLYLFEKELLIGKKREDGLINVKTHISCSNLMLIERIPKEPLGFNVIPFANPTIQYTILSKNQEQKMLWTHEIKRMILENYGSNIPTKVKELILKSTTPEPGQSQQQEHEENLSRDKKTRKSRRKRRRNSEPMNKLLRVTTSDPTPTSSSNTAMTKLQRGQRQVKAALENILWPERGEDKRMKKPAINYRRRNSEFPIGNEALADVLTDDSLDQDEGEHTKRQQCMEDLTAKVRRNSSFTLPSTGATRRSHDGRESPRPYNRRSLEFDGSFSTLSEEDQELPARRISRSRAGSRGNKESNRDSGIGSMTLSEHLKLDLDERGSNDGEKADSVTEEQSDPGDVILQSHRKKTDSFSKFDTEDDDEDEDAMKVDKSMSMDSPDELEALEALDEKIDASIVYKGGNFDLDPLPAWDTSNVSPMSPPDEAFKLRHKDIRNFRRMSSGSQGNPEDEEIWVKMPPTSRGRSLGSARPLSAEVTGHPHFAKIPLARSNSENFKTLNEKSFHIRTYSDPNMIDTQIDKDNDSKSTQRLDLSISTLGASDEFSISSTSSHEENLLDSVNSAFKRLGEKYALKSGLLSEESDENKTENESDNLEDTDNKKPVVRKLEIRRTRQVDVKDNETDHPDNLGDSHRTDKTVDASKNVAESEHTEDEPPSYAKRRVHKLAREYSRRAKSLERPSTLVKHKSEPLIKTGFNIEQDESDNESIGLARKPKGELAQKVQSLKQALNESKEKVSQVKVKLVEDKSRTAPAQYSDSSTSEGDRVSRVSRPTEPVAKGRSKPAKVQDKVKQYESLSPKRNFEPKVVAPNASMSIQQRLRTIQESSDHYRRSRSMDRSYYVEGRRTSPNKSPLKSLKERKLELEEWAAKPPVSPGRYRSEGAFLGVAGAEGITNEDSVDERDNEVFSSRSSRTSSVQSSESASPLPQRSGSEDMSRRWSSHSSSLSEEDQVLFKSIKDRFRELEKAVSKPVPRTCQDVKAEIKAIAKTEKYQVRDVDSGAEIKAIAKTEKYQVRDVDSDAEIDSARYQYEHYDIKEGDDEAFTDEVIEQVVHADESDSRTLDVQKETGSSLPEEEVNLAKPEVKPELVETGATGAKVDDHEAKHESSSDSDTLKRSKAEELMRELSMLSLSTVSDFEADTIKRCKDKMARKLKTSQTLTLSTPSADTKDIPIEEDPRSTSTQYSLELDVIPIEETHLMDHNYQSTSVDDTCVPTRVMSKVDIDRDTRSEGGMSPERKPLPLERVMSSDSNIFLDAKSDLGGSEDSSSQSGFVTPVESFSQE